MTLSAAASSFSPLRFSTDPSQTPVLEGGDECAFLMHARKIVAMTAEARRLLSDPNSFKVQDSRFSLGDARADQWLYESVAALTTTQQREAIRKIPRQVLIATHPDEYILTLVRVRLKLEVGVKVDSMLFVHNHTKASGGLTKLVQEGRAWAELGFTQAETIIASFLLDGRSVSEIAEIQSISKEGVRFHIKGLLSKTRCHRQSQLVAKLARLLWNPAG